jgi:hypothetical protein
MVMAPSLLRWTSIAGTLGESNGVQVQAWNPAALPRSFQAQVEDDDDHRRAFIATSAGSLRRFHGRIRTGSRRDASVNVHGERRRR